MPTITPRVGEQVRVNSRYVNVDYVVVTVIELCDVVDNGYGHREPGFLGETSYGQRSFYQNSDVCAAPARRSA